MKKIFIAVITFMTTMSIAVSGFAAPMAKPDDQPKISAQKALVFDAGTGQILYQKNANKIGAIASMSKLLSTYIILDSIKKGQMHWNDQVKISANLEKVSNDKELTNVPLKAGQSYSVRDLLNASLITSANAAIIALGNAEAGSSRAFVDQMRVQATKWGIKDAKIYNAAGLAEKQIGSDAYPHTAPNDENLMTPKDMGKIAFHLVKDFPEVLKITSKFHEKFNTGATEMEITNHNELLKGGKDYDANFKSDGLKTGTSDLAQGCFTGTTKISNRRVISVVMASKDDQDTRFKDSTALYKYVQKTYYPKIIKKNSTLNGANAVKVPNAKKQMVELKNSKKVVYWLNAAKKSQVKVRSLVINKKLLKNKELQAPIDSKKTVATAELNRTNANDQFLNTKYGAKVTLHSKNKIEKANIFVLAGRWIASLFN
ncbi:serine hydrolase [Pediococcus argentinicus]|uniref:serine hydrolase n=1 Tax=Pediococcus argentinicus TaxID=480391 RepID=UPI00338DAE05